MKLRQTLAIAAIATAFGAGAANAAVYIGYSTDGGVTITQEASGTSSALFAGTVGVFTTNVTSSFTGPLPDLLNSVSQNQIFASGAGTLNIYVTETGFTYPIGTPASYLSGLTSNTLPSGWSVKEQTFLDSADDNPPSGDWGTVTLLASDTFTTNGTSVQLDTANTGLGPYSLTEEYTVTATGSGQALSTIDISAAVPEPATWAMFLVGFGAVGFAMRRPLRKIVVPFA